MANPAQQAALAKLAASFGSLAKSLPPAPKPAPVISGSVNAGGGGGRPVPQTSVRVPWSIAPPKPAAPPAFHPIQRLGTTIAGAPGPGGSRSGGTRPTQTA